jgi:hypothetical protein
MVVHATQEEEEEEEEEEEAVIHSIRIQIKLNPH